MTSSQNRVKRPDTQPAIERGFAGQSPLISGMLAKRDQVMASSIILRLVNRTVADAQAKEQYAKKVLSLAKGISETRRSERITKMIQEVMEEQQGVPETRREALEMALKKKRVTAEILDERKATHFSLFKIRYDGQEKSIPFPNSIMEGDPVANFAKVLATVGIVSSNKELMESRREEIGSTRPPAEPIEVDQKQLEGRKISYDGKLGDTVMHFTYYSEGINTSMGIPGDLKNGELLAEIDRKIIKIHEAYDVPLDAAVVEQQASEKPSFRVPSDDEVERIANGLHLIVRKGVVAKRVPEEYRAAIEVLKSSPEHYAIKTVTPITEDEARDFAESFKALDNPAHMMVRLLHPYYCGKDGELTDEGKQIVTDTLKFGEKGKVNISPAALANIATAYSMLTGQNTAGWKEDELRSKHLGMMFAIRTKMKELTGTLIFRPVTA